MFRFSTFNSRLCFSPNSGASTFEARTLSALIQVFAFCSAFR
jgi:hypothetical protein